MLRKRLCLRVICLIGHYVIINNCLFSKVLYLLSKDTFLARGHCLSTPKEFTKRKMRAVILILVFRYETSESVHG